MNINPFSQPKNYFENVNVFSGKNNKFAERLVSYSMTQLVLNIEDKSMVASLKRVLATMNGVTIATTKKISSYEKSKIEAQNGKINTYSSVNELFAKIGL